MKHVDLPEKLQNLLIHALDLSPSTIMLTDSQGMIIYANKTFSLLTGFEPEEVIGKNVSILNSGLTDPAVFADMWRSIKSGQNWSGEFTNLRQNGKIYWERAIISPVTENGITYYLAVKEDITEKKLLEQELVEKNRELESLALKDYLTGLYNRRFFIEEVEKEIALFERYKSDLALAMIDIDNFKSVNDTYGHIFGDHVIKQVASSIEKIIRETDTSCRFGGEEFAILFRNTRKLKAYSIAERIRKQIKELCITSGDVYQPVHISVSIGITDYSPQHMETSLDLINEADHMLYKAKENGKNKVVFQ